MNLTKKVAERLNKQGVEFPLKGTAQELDLVLNTFMMEKEIDVTSVKEYFATVKPSTKELIAGLTKLSKDQSEVSKEALNIIKNTIVVLQEQLMNKDLSLEEREMTYDLIKECILEARRESSDERGFRINLGMVALGGIVVVAGVAVFVISRGNTDIITKGANMVNV